MKSKDIKVMLALVLTVCIILLALLLIIMNINKPGEGSREGIENFVPNEMSEEEYEQMYEEDGDYFVKRNKEAHITKQEYNGAKVCVQQYVDLLTKTNASNYDENGNRSKEKIYQVLDKQYIENNNITEENVLEKVKEVEKSVLLTIIEMNNLKQNQEENSQQVESLAVHALLQSIQDYSIVQDIYLIVQIDKTNLTFSIQPLENIKDIEEININNNITSIEANDNNQFKYAVTTDEDIVAEYINTYKRLILVHPEYIYQRLDEQYRKENFSNLQEFKKYVEENKEIINQIRVEDYQVDNTNPEYTQYTCFDQFGNYYIFNEVSAMNYNIILS